MTTLIEDRSLEAPPSSFVVTSHRGGIEVIDRLAEEWRGLCSVSADDQPFFRPEFIRAHIRAVVPYAKLQIVTARRDGHLRLLLPMVEDVGTFSKVPVRRLRAPVNFNCGRFDGVRHSGSEGDAAVRAAWLYLKKLSGWDLLQFRDAQEHSTVARLVSVAQADGFRTIRQSDRPNPYVPVPSDPELLKNLPPNSKLRSQLRQARRRLAEKGALKFLRIDTFDRDALDRFFELEAAGWKGQNGSAVNCHAPSRQFFNELAESAARYGYFSLYMLELDGVLIAAHFSLAYQGHCYSPVVTYDENFKSFAPGHLIIAEILQDCATRGLRGYDITGQDQDWKMKWTTEARPVNHHFVFRGSLGNVAYVVASRVRPAIGRLLSEQRKAA